MSIKVTYSYVNKCILKRLLYSLQRIDLLNIYIVIIKFQVILNLFLVDLVFKMAKKSKLCLIMYIYTRQNLQIFCAENPSHGGGTAPL